jgi:uncharacterized protein DUF2530
VTGPTRPVPPPLEGSDQLITGIITAGWAVAFLVVLALHASIPAADHWWLWTCAAGTGIGLFGLAYVPRLKHSRERAAQRRAKAESAETGSA